MSFCPSCGARLHAVPEKPLGPSLTVRPYDQPEFDADMRALRKTRLFAIILLISGAVGIALYGVLFAYGLFSYLALRPASISTPSSAFSNYLAISALSVILGGVFAVLAVLQLWSALRSLAKVDGERFELPSKLTLALLISEPFIFAGFAVFFFLASGLQASTTPSLPAVAYLIVGFFLMGIAGIVALVGSIGGVVLGLWRMGTRYGESTLHISAIFYIIPFLQLIGAILLIVGTGSAIGKVRNAAPTAG